jgi:hypothetical protein
VGPGRLHPLIDGVFAIAEGAQLRAPRRRPDGRYTTDDATDDAQRNEITASPLHASLQQLSGLPPALVITDEPRQDVPVPPSESCERPGVAASGAIRQRPNRSIAST